MPGKYNEMYKERNRRYRREAINHYGGKCECCDENIYEFLTFDHLDNDGAQHRREQGVGTGTQFISWLRRNNYPIGVVQVLCANCNHAKAHYECCPHKKDQSF